MFCKICGKRIDDDSKYCSYCGTKQQLRTTPIRNNIKVRRTEAHNKQKFDSGYKKEVDATIAGAVLLVISFLLTVIGPFSIPELQSNQNIRLNYALISITVRILSGIWVANITKNQNRDSSSWGLFTFFFPSIGLIIVGLLNKLNEEVEEPELEIDGQERKEYGFKIVNQEKSWDGIYGKHEIISVNFNNGLKSKVYRGSKSGKYFYAEDTTRPIYCANIEEAIRKSFEFASKQTFR